MKKMLSLLAALLAFAAMPVLAGLAEDRAKADAYLEAGDTKKAFKAYRSLARDGDHDAQFTLAEMYETGVGTRIDLVDAYAWSVLAAESDLEALGLYSEQVLSQIQDKDKARRAALKLKEKYGKEALAEKAERLAVRGNGQRYGSCTGSRISCSGRVEAIQLNGSETTAPPVASGGN